MKVQFLETMRGSLTGPDGVERPAEFTVAASSESVRGFVVDGRAALRGVMRAAPWAAESPCSGELTITRMPPRLGYHLTFTGEDGRTLTLRGAKHVNARQLLTTMTHLSVVLLDPDGSVLAQGTLRFDLRDLLPFLATFLPFVRAPRLRLDAARRSLARRALEA